jgi:hypothetical protein
MGHLVDSRIASPGDGRDVITRAVVTHLKEGRITRDQLVAHAFLLLVSLGVLWGCNAFTC